MMLAKEDRALSLKRPSIVTKLMTKGCLCEMRGRPDVYTDMPHGWHAHQ